MFESIQEGLSGALRKIRGGTKFTEANMKEALRDIRRALIDADVNVQVATRFAERVEKAAAGRDVLKTLKPAQQIFEVVYEELVALMGPVDPQIRLNPSKPTVLMMCGLQGSGKTTTCGKLAKMLKGHGQHPMLVAADLQRPAAVEQLKVLGAQLGVPVYSEEGSDPVTVCNNAVRQAKEHRANVVILDTAGRLDIDDALMAELETIDRKVGPDQAYFVCDAMTGQRAVDTAKAFNERLELDAVILTKLDGDARGGAALSIKEVTGVPVKFVGTGEKLDALEPFEAEGMASRILGQGDMMALIRKARTEITEDEAREQEAKIKEGSFDLNDFLGHLGKVRGMGSMKNLMEMLPGGMGAMMPEGMDADKEFNRVEAMLRSMTPAERSDPDLLKEINRRRRVAKGSGVEHHEVNKLVKQFEDMRGIMKQMSGKSMMGRMKDLMSLSRGQLPGMGGPGGGVPKVKGSTKADPLSADRRRELRKKERKRKKKQRRK